MAENAILWFRNDLRLADNPALAAARARGGAVHALYVHETGPGRPPGGAARWWLHRSLGRLAADLARLGIGLEVRSGEAGRVLDAAVKRHGAGAVHWNRRYAPAERAADETIMSALKGRGLQVRSFNAALLCEPWRIETRAGGPYGVFTPFWKALRTGDVDAPGPRPRARKGEGMAPPGDPDAGYAAPPWAEKLGDHWTPGEAGAREALAAFIDGHLGDYPALRDVPGADATSRLSPHLRFGEIGPRQVWHAVLAAREAGRGLDRGAEKFLSELGWREFSHHLLFHKPDIARHPMREVFEGLQWRTDAKSLRAWQRGETGIPLVDAGMRQLWQTGWMHNRVRMVVASFLVKNLLIDWREGEAWFWDTLVDADAANNPANWQWVAGCGADAAPFFRIFNPVLQGRKFDADGAYVRRFVPEIAGLPDKWLHAPFDAPREALDAAGIALGDTYPAPLVDLKRSRERALAALGGA